jgi:membrane-associated phospholipid phosphatase
MQINIHHFSWLDRLLEVFNWLGEGWLIGLIAFIFFLFKPFRNVWFFASGLLCTILPSLLTQLIKYQVEAPRPMSMFKGQSWVHHLSHWDLLHNNSFPSGHTTGAFSLFCFLSCAMPRSYRFLGVIFFLLAISVAYARIYLAAHFFIDVYIGSFIGTFVSFLLMSIVYYMKYQKEHNSL